MKLKKIYVLLLLLPLMSFSQDLELGVHVLPTSVIGDRIMFNITVRNKDEDPAKGVRVKVNMRSGLKFSSFTPNTQDFDPETGIWRIGTVDRYKAKVLGVIAFYATKDDAILSAEIIASSGIDPDSTPGNGIDTNGNGIIVHDKGDEDDGDAAQNGPYN
ncbi:DUF11 domain-containing protein [Poritiphilus flavus]|uniref:DUF11 domain-containing protein n=1 Tax=Poritiphilus flavus TaxID=2697053 RepID=A0A6L9EI79_9FLAO|nr:DUF11 domain-containing protein [Poritiphilus flavus]NAS14393.1 hypothetical protein [Poritiphilus flavus]